MFVPREKYAPTFLLTASLIVGGFTTPSPTAAQAPAQDLTVLPDPFEGGPPREMMKRNLKGLAQEALDQRRKTVDALKTPKEIAAYQQRLRQIFLDQLGGLPQKTPLKAQVVARRDGDACRIENILFESRPRHFVSANLYLPKSKGPHLAVLVSMGHYEDGKLAHQNVGIFLAQNGLAALVYDPIGQGERHQFLTADGKPRFRATDEHTLLGISCILVGRNTATCRIWDGMRALDYLDSRDDIVHGKYGCTGVSGGGTLTEYLMALDERIVCAAPGCAPMTFSRRLATIGPGDAEQNIFAQIALGLDHPDYFHLHAPQPTLILAASQDFVDQQGTWDLFRDASRVYAKLGHAERIALVEADAKHGFSQTLREAMVRWMRRWLLGVDDAVCEPKLKMLPAADLLCTPRGEVMLLEGARSVVDFNSDLAEQWAAQRKKLWEPDQRSKALAEVRKLAGIAPLKELSRPNVRAVGKVEHPGYTIEKWIIEPGPGLWLPALYFTPKKVTGERVLYVHGQGKLVDAGRDGPIERLALQGHPVLTFDLRGTGETGPAPNKQWGGSYSDLFMAYLLGKSFVGMRAEDVLVTARLLAELDTKQPVPVRLIALGDAGPPALHAAALEKQLFSHVVLRGAPTSWLATVRDPTPPGQLVHAVHGALRAYDLTDLAASFPQGSLTEEQAGKK
jgi:cephalosporin-C deacetylase-like acetyl esterase